MVTKLYTLREACEYLKISTATMYRLVKAKEISYNKIGKGRGMYRFTQEDLDHYLQKSRVDET